MLLNEYEQFIDRVTFKDLGLDETKNVFPVGFLQEQCPDWDPEKCRNCTGSMVLKESALIDYIKKALFKDLFGTNRSEEALKFLRCVMKDQFRVCILIRQNSFAVFYMSGNSDRLFGKKVAVNWLDPDECKKVGELIKSDFPKESTRYFLLVEDINDADMLSVRSIPNTGTDSYLS